MGVGAVPLDASLFDFTVPFILADMVVVAGGGWPRFWENIDSIISGVGDMLYKIGQIFKELWDGLWKQFGGGLRWVYQSLLNFLRWSFDAVSTLIQNAGGLVGDVSGWLWERLIGVWTFMREHVGGALGWLYTNIVSIVLRGVSYLKDAIDWLATPLGFLAEFINNYIRDIANWLWGELTDAVTAARDLLADAIAWVGRGLAVVGEGIQRYVGDTASWLLRQLSSAISGAAQTAGEAIQAAFQWLVDHARDFFAGLGEILRDSITWVLEHTLDPVRDLIVRKLAIPLRYAQGDFATGEAHLDAIFDPPDTTNLVTLITWMFAAFLSAAYSFFPIMQGQNQLFVQDGMRRWRPRLLSESALFDALHRGLQVPDGLRLQLSRWGYPEASIDTLIKLSEMLPTPTDMVRFGVREVYTPEIAERFGQFQDLPPAFVQDMELLGFLPDRSRQYWAAHWDLPSASQGFEMLHRRVIDDADLRLLLRSLDVMPFWRDKLIQISFNPLTRVDVRRMYQDGVLDEQGVLNAYLDIGYTPENARLLADWTKIRYPRGGKGPGADLREITVGAIQNAYFRRLIDREEALDRLAQVDYALDDAELIVATWDFDLGINTDLRFPPGMRDVSRSTIEKAYERRLFDFERALQELVELGFTQDDAELMLALVDQRLAEALTELEIDAVLNDLEAGAIDEATARARIAGTGLSPGRVDYLVQLEVLRRQVKTRRLTVAQLQRAFRAGVIPTAEALLDRITLLGYNEGDAAVLVAIT